MPFGSDFCDTPCGEVLDGKLLYLYRMFLLGLDNA